MNHRIYFNRCFTTTSKLIDQMKDNPNGDTFDIVMSHSTPNHYLSAHSEHFELEPVLSGEEYTNYILGNLEKHNIEYFFPRYQVTDLAEAEEQIRQMGVTPMFVGSPEMYRFIDDKVAVYNDLKETDILPIPETFTIRNLKEFQEAYVQILSLGSKACIKPITGIGGEGFKRIVEMSETEEAFLSSSSALSRTRLERVLASEGEIAPFMMSELMEEKEWSIDCLAKNGELLIAIPRCKDDAYRQTIEFRQELIDIAEKITKRYNLSYLFNIQVKYHYGLPYLVEINTRFSGGMYKTAATGANMMYWAFQLLKGNDPDIPSVKQNVKLYDSLDFAVRSIEETSLVQSMENSF